MDEDSKRICARRPVAASDDPYGCQTPDRFALAHSAWPTMCQSRRVAVFQQSMRRVAAAVLRDILRHFPTFVHARADARQPAYRFRCSFVRRPFCVRSWHCAFQYYCLASITIEAVERSLQMQQSARCLRMDMTKQIIHNRSKRARRTRIAVLSRRLDHRRQNS